MPRVDNFHVLAEMFRRNKSAKLFPMQNFVSGQLVKKFGGHVTMGVDHETIMEMLAGKSFAGGLILADQEQIDELKLEMQEELDRKENTDVATRKRRLI